MKKKIQEQTHPLEFSNEPSLSTNGPKYAHHADAKITSYCLKRDIWGPTRPTKWIYKMWTCRDTWNKHDQNGELYSLSGGFFFPGFFSGHGGDRDLERILMPLVCDGDYECAWHSTLFLNLLRQQREYDDDFHCTLFTSSSPLSPTKICTHSWRKE